MIQWTPIVWRSLGATLALSLGAAACQPSPSQESQSKAAPIAGEGGESGEAAMAQAGEGGEQGEAGAASALAGLTPAATVDLNRWRLWGFTAVAAAEASNANLAEAGALIGQGLLEVFPTPPPGLDLTALRALDNDAAKAGATAAAFSARLSSAQAALIAGAPVSADIVKRLLELAVGLYREADKGAAGVDPLEYQHSLGAVLAAQAALQALKQSPGAKREALAKADTALAALRAQYAPLRAPDVIVPHGAIAAQASRVELELSGL